MSGLTGSIERFLKELIEDAADGVIEIGRNDLAIRFNCAPSQINYVLTTRFTPYKGYYIESRRGGSGYIKIIKLSIESDGYIEKIIQDVVSDAITMDRANQVLETLKEESIITSREAIIMKHALDKEALKDVEADSRNKWRANILRSMLLVFLR